MRVNPRNLPYYVCFWATPLPPFRCGRPLCMVPKENTIQSDQQNHLLSFRIYDREGNGYITTDVLKEILKEIDPGLTNDDLDNIIEEVDEDGSGTLDFDGEHSFGAFTVTIKPTARYRVVQLLK